MTQRVNEGDLLVPLLERTARSDRRPRDVVAVGEEDVHRSSMDTRSAPVKGYRQASAVPAP